jgi:prephenate dehydratase
MQSQSAISRSYARAFAVRARIAEIRDVLSHKQGWTQTAQFLSGRFELAFRFFLDAPTPARLDTILAFEADMARIARNLPELERFRRPG